MTQRAVSSIAQSLTYRHRRRSVAAFYNALLVYASMSEEANMKLVELVWEHPILYDWKDPGYSRKEKTDLVWESIGKELNESAQSCKDRWKNLRTAYVRNRKKRSGSEAPTGKSYYLDDVMQFLIPYIKPSKKQDGYLTSLRGKGKKKPSSRKDSSESEAACVEEKCEISETSVWTAEEIASLQEKQMLSEPKAGETGPMILSEPKQQSKKRGRENGDEVDNVFISYMKPSVAFRNQQNADAEFLHSLLPDISSMNPQQKRKFKIEVLKLIDDCLKEPSTSQWASHLAPDYGANIALKHPDSS